MGITSNTQFFILKEKILSEENHTKNLLIENYNNDAISNIDLNKMYIGKNFFTIETLIHEINEIENSHLLKKINSGIYDLKINNQYVSHLISPYGEDTLIYPFTSIENEEKLL